MATRTVSVKVVTVLPSESTAATVMVGVSVAPPTEPLIAVVKESRTAAPAVVANALDVALVNSGLVATRVKPAPVLFIESVENVAMPATAFTVVVPLSSAPTVLVPNATVTGPVKVAAVLLFTSCTVTTTGASAVPTVVVAGGCVVIASFVGVDAVAVAVNVTGEPVRPAAVAVNDCAPTKVPSRQVVCAIPLTSVATVAAPTTPLLEAANATDTPCTGSPSVAFTRTVTCCASREPVGPVCVLPETSVMLAGVG